MVQRGRPRMKGITPVHIRAIELYDKGARPCHIVKKLEIEFPEAHINYSTVKTWCSTYANEIRESARQTPPIKIHTEPHSESKPLPVESGGSFFDEDILLFDIETLANQGYFFDTFSDRGIPLQFVRKHKAVCTIAYKWLGSGKTNVLVMDAPYSDKSVLEAFLPIYERAKYVVAHYGDGFDIPFLDGRLFVNKLGQLPKKRSLDTYKVAKKRFGRTLNSNKLDNLGTLLGLGNKNKTDAMLWVKCAEGDPEAIKEMALYNVQDVDLLEKVFIELRPYFSDKMNMNLFVDDVTNRCKSCGSENLIQIGYEITQAQMKPQYRCGDCSAVSAFRAKKDIQ